MSSGRVHIKYTSEISQANAAINKLNAQLRKQQKQMQSMRDESAKSTKTQNTMLVNMTRNISAAALAYDGFYRAIDLVNSALERQQELQQGNIAPAEKIGAMTKRFWTNLGVDITNAQRQMATANLFEAIKEAGVTGEQGLRFAGAFASGVGAASFEDVDKFLEAIEKASDAGMALAGAYDPAAVGMIIADYTKFGYTIEEAISMLVSVQKELHATDIAQQQFLMRSLASSRVFHKNWKDLTDERKKQVATEMLAITTGMTQEMLTKGIEMPSTAASGIMLTAYEKWGEYLMGKSPFEIMRFIQEQGLAEGLELKDIRGESVGKPVVQSVFQGLESWMTMQSIEEALRKSSPEDAQRLMEAYKQGVPGFRQPGVTSAENRRRFIEDVARSNIATPSQIDENRRSFENLFQNVPSFVPYKLGEVESLLEGANISPNLQRRRLLVAAQRQALFRENPILASIFATSGGPGLDVLTTGGRFVPGVADIPSINQIMQSWRADPSEENMLGFGGMLTSDQLESLRNALREIDRSERLRAEDQNAIRVDQSNSKEQTRVLKSSVEQAGAVKAVGRHTEGD